MIRTNEGGGVPRARPLLNSDGGVIDFMLLSRRTAAADASQKMRAVLDRGREVLAAAQTERTLIEADRLRQAEESKKKAQEPKPTLRRGRGPSMGM